MASIVFDASAVMAIVFNEPGEELVRQHAGTAAMSAVNISEVYARSVERGMPEAFVDETIRALAVNRYAFAEGDDRQTARLRPVTRHLDLSLADRACLALGRRLGLPVLTADRNWKKLDIGVDIRLIR